MEHLEYASHDAVALAELVRSGQVSPRDLVEAAVSRIEAVDGELNAVVHRNFERALADAESRELPDGRFRGVPFLLKDLLPASAGDPLHLGMKALKEVNYVHPSDCNLASLYRKAGFVFLGRTNVPELGLVAATEPVVYGPTANPWNKALATGGSSGGSAAAVASGMVPVAGGSDGGGSIRIPAALCGLVGLKPSTGRISKGPLSEEWGFSVPHVLCRSVRDCAALLDTEAVWFPGDGIRLPLPERPYAEIISEPVGPLKIGLRTAHPAGSGTEVHPDCSAAAERVGNVLEGLGHVVETAGPSALDGDLIHPFITIWGASLAFTLDRLALMVGRELTADDMEPASWMMAERGRLVSARELLAATDAVMHFRRAMAGWWADGWDLLLTPTTAAPAPPLGSLMCTPEDPMRGFNGSIPYAAFTLPYNMTGQPAVSLPLGLDGGGAPLGVQLAAAFGREDLLLGVSAQLEAAEGWSLPGVGALS